MGTSTEPKRKMPFQTKLRFGFNIAMIALFSYTSWEAWGFQSLARYLPLLISLVALVVMILSMVIDVLAWRRQGVVAADDVPVTAALAGSELKERKLEETGRSGSTRTEAPPAGSSPDETAAEEPDPDTEIDEARVGPIEPPNAIIKRSAVIFGWILGYMVGIAVVGIMAASALFLLGYLFMQAKTGWKIPVIGTALILVVLTVMRESLNLEWPPYLLEDVFEAIVPS